MLLVGRLPGAKRSQRIRRAIRDVLGEHPYVCVEFADDSARPENVRPLIDLAFIVLFDVSRSRDVETFLDLGYALGRGKYCVLLRGSRSARTAGFEGDDRLDYQSIRELRQGLGSSVAEWAGDAIRKYTAEGEVYADMDARLMAPLGASLLEGDLDDEFTVASGHGFSEEQVERTLAVLIELGMVRVTDDGWTVTDSGRAQLPRLISRMGGADR